MVLSVSNLTFNESSTSEIALDGLDNIVIKVSGQEKIRVSPNGVSISANTLNINGSLSSQQPTRLERVNVGSLVVSSGSNNVISGDATMGNVSVSTSTDANAHMNVTSLIVGGNAVNMAAILWNHINSAVVSGVTEFSLQNLTAYKWLRITMSNMTMGNTNNSFFQIRFGSTAGVPLTTLYEHRQYSCVIPGNNLNNITTSAAAKMLFPDKFTNYANAISNSASAGGFTGTITITPWNTAQKTKVNARYVYEDAAAQIQILEHDGQHSAQTIMNGFFIAANTNSTQVPTFSGTIITEGIIG
jgi:hypothetical protein